MEIQLTMKQLFELFDANTIENETVFPVPTDTIEILSPNGYVPIRSLVKKNHEAKTYHFENGESLVSSNKHIIFNDGVDTFIDSATFVDTISGKLNITNSVPAGTIDLYDVALDYPHQYVTPNGIIHHNTSLIHVLLNSIDDIDSNDIMEMNMSDSGMDDIREKVLPFCQTMPFGAYKIVILEEFELCSHKGQGSLKRIMEEYSDSVRFLVTSNTPNKILPPIRSRLQEIQIESHDYNQFMGKVVEILLAKEVQIGGQEDLDRIERYVKSTYPDFRKCINTLQQNFIDGKIIELNSTTSGTADFKVELVNSIQNGNLSAVRKQIVSSVRDDQIEGFFSFLYQEIEMWIPVGLDTMSAEMLRMVLILKIRDGLVKDTTCADRELNMTATLCDLQQAVHEAIA